MRTLFAITSADDFVVTVRTTEKDANAIAEHLNNIQMTQMYECYLAAAAQEGGLDELRTFDTEERRKVFLDMVSSNEKFAMPPQYKIAKCDLDDEQFAALRQKLADLNQLPE